MSDPNSSPVETVGNELWRQCWKGDVDAVRKALRGGTDVNEVGNDEVTCLMLAVREGHSSIVEILLKEPGIDVTRRDVNGSTALHLACRYGRVDLVHQLLEHYGTLYCLEWQDKWGETPLLTATRKGHLLCVERLLQVPGIHLTTKDGRDKGLVDVARETGNAELVDCVRKAVRTRGGEVNFESEKHSSLTNREESIVTQNTESPNDVQKQHENVAEVESAIEIKQEVEDGGESSSALALPQDQLGKKRKRSTSPVDRKKSLRCKKLTSICQEVTEKPGQNEGANPTFIDYNLFVRKLLHSDDIPTDVVFKVFELREDSNVTARRVVELKAHKFLLALASTYFHQMIYNTPGGCDLSEVMTINVENTSKEAVEKMIYFLYNHPIGLDNVSLATLFHMVDLAERFCLPSLKQLLEIHLNSLNALTTSDIMEAATAVFNLTCFSSSLLDCCAKVLAKNFQDSKAIFDWAGHLVKEKQQQLGMELMARMGKFLTCSNCRSQPCLSGSAVASGAMRVGLKVRSNPDSEYMVNAADLGVGVVSGKNSLKGWAKVKGEQGMWLGGCKFLLCVVDLPSFVYSCDNY